MPYGFGYHRFNIHTFNDRTHSAVGIDGLTSQDLIRIEFLKTILDSDDISDQYRAAVAKKVIENLTQTDTFSFNIAKKESEGIDTCDTVIKHAKKVLSDINLLNDSSHRKPTKHSIEILNIPEDIKFDITVIKKDIAFLSDTVRAQITDLPAIVFVDNMRVRQNNLQINDSSNNRISTCSFEIQAPGESTLRACRQRADVKVFVLDGEKVDYFGGRIIQNSLSADGAIKILSITAEDYTAESADYIVTQTYNDTITNIIENMWNTYYERPFIAKITPTDEIVQVSFNYDTLFDATEYLVSLLGWHWYVDFDGRQRVLRVFPPESNLYNKELSSQNVLANTPKFEEGSDIVNAVYLFGGQGISQPVIEEEVADGEKAIYTTAYKPVELKVYVDNVPQSIGIENIHDAEDVDLLMNYNEKVLKWREDNKPSAGSVVKKIYKYYYPIAVYLEDPVSIEKYGKVVKRIEDKKVSTPEQARKKAQKILEDQAQPKLNGTLDTIEPGIRAGMYVSINLPKYNAVGVFYVAEVQKRIENQYFVSTLTLNKVTDSAAIFALKMKELVQRIEQLENKEKEDVIVQRFQQAGQDVLIEENTTILWGRSVNFEFGTAQFNRSNFT